jgi:hypothetical protein
MITKDSYLLKPYIVVNDMGPHPRMIVGFYDHTNMLGKRFRFKQVLSNVMSERSFEYYCDRYWRTKVDLSRYSGKIVSREYCGVIMKDYYFLFKNPSYFEKEFSCMVPSGRCCRTGRTRRNASSGFSKCGDCGYVDYYRFVGTKCWGKDCRVYPMFQKFSYGVRELSRLLCSIESVMRARWKRGRRRVVSQKAP